MTSWHQQAKPRQRPGGPPRPEACWAPATAQQRRRGSTRSALPRASCRPHRIAHVTVPWPIPLPIASSQPRWAASGTGLSAAGRTKNQTGRRLIGTARASHRPVSSCTRHRGDLQPSHPQPESGTGLADVCRHRGAQCRCGLRPPAHGGPEPPRSPAAGQPAGNVARRHQPRRPHQTQAALDFPAVSLLVARTPQAAPAKAPGQDHGQRGHNALPHRSDPQGPAVPAITAPLIPRVRPAPTRQPAPTATPGS